MLLIWTDYENEHMKNAIQLQAENGNGRQMRTEVGVLKFMSVLLSWHEGAGTERNGTNPEGKGADDGEPRLHTNTGNYCSEATAAGGFPFPN